MPGPFLRLLALLTVVACPYLHAQDEALAEAGLPFLRNYGPKEYGAQGQNWAIVQDARGVIYVGNNEGALEFDGLRWRLIRTSNTSTVRSMAVDEKGRIHVGATGELGYLEPDATGQMRYVSLRDRLPAESRDFSEVWRTFVTPEGVYYSSFRRLFRVNGSEVRVWSPETAFHLSFLVRGRLFVREVDRGLKEMVDGRLQLVPGGERFAQERIYAMLPWEGEGRDGATSKAILIGTRTQGFFVLDGETYRPFPTGDDEALKRDQLSCAVPLADGRLALGTIQGGVSFVDARGRFLGRLDKARGLQHNTVSAAFTDREGGLWLGLDRGITRVAVSSPLTRFDDRTELPGLVLSIHRHGGRLYAGTAHGLFRLEPGPGARFRQIPGYQGQTWAFLSHGDALLVAATPGVYEVRGDTAELVLKPDSAAAFVLHASRASPGRVFVGLLDGLTAMRQEGGRWLAEGRVAGVSENVRTLLETPDGRLWAGTYSMGALRVTFPKEGGAPLVERFGTAQGLPGASHDYVHEIGGETRFLTHRNVFRFDEGKGRFEPDPSFAGLFPEGPRWLYKLATDTQGRIWMQSADEGRNLREAGVAVQEPDGTYRWDAAPFRAFSGSWNEAVHADGDGVVWFGGEEGLFRYDPRAAGDSGPGFSALVRQVGGPGGGGTIHGGAGEPMAPRIPYERNSLRFEYAAPSFDDPSATRFQVLLEGNDRDWSEWTAEGYREYTNLREGAYRLRVRARNLHGAKSREGSYAFRVLPPFYRTVWAYLAYGLLALGLGWVAVRWRVRRVEAEKRALEKTVAERTGELRSTNERLLTVNTELHSTTERLRATVDELRQVQEQLAHLSESTPEKLENVSGWGAAMAREIARAIGAREIGIWRIASEEVVPIASGTTRAPSRELVRSAVESGGAERLATSADETLVPVRGLTGELRGALVIVGPVVWGELERRLTLGFAQHLGNALELRHLREQLTATEARQASARKRMHDDGVRALLICPSCRRCFDDTASACEVDGGALDGTRLLPFRVAGRYRLVSLLGEGGMGTVFEALDEKLLRRVAVKVIRAERLSDPDTRFRVEREARTLAQLRHPAVTGLFDSGELEDGSAFLILELLQGRDLEDVLRAHGPGSRAQVAALLRQTGAGLGAAHRLGVIHRDIKPANVFLVPAEGGFQAKVLDFGLAQWREADVRLTRSGMIVGTPAYMSPEQVGGRRLDAATDVYSLAAVGYEALTGCRVVSGLDMGKVLVEVLYDVPPPVSTHLPGVPRELDEAFAAALRKEPEKRPDDVEVWAGSVAALLEGLVESAVPRPGWPEGFLVSDLRFQDEDGNPTMSRVQPAAP